MATRMQGTGGGIVVTRRAARYVAAAAAVVATGLYMLIGVGTLSVGTSTATGGTTDLFAFGMLAGGMYALVAALILLVDSRVAYALLAVLDLGVIIGYFAMASARDPSFEMWGLLVKAAQAVVLGALIYLVMQREGAEVGRQPEN